MYNISKTIIWLRKGLIYILFLAGLPFPLLLNGQEFTNGLTAIGCCLAAILLDLGTCWFRDRSGKAIGADVGIVFCGLVFIVFIAVQLPWSYRHQKSFNKAVEAATKLNARHTIGEQNK